LDIPFRWRGFAIRAFVIFHSVLFGPDCKSAPALDIPFRWRGFAIRAFAIFYLVLFGPDCKSAPAMAFITQSFY